MWRPISTQPSATVGLWLLVGLCAACAGPSPADFAATAPATGTPPELAADEYFVRLPAARRDGQTLDRLQALLARHGATVRHAYSARVGLEGTLSIRTDPQGVAALHTEWPELFVHPAVLRYLNNCGDGVCSSDEAAQAARTSTCSLDCGVPPPRAQRGELQNSPELATVGADAAWATTRGDGVHVCVLDTGYDSGMASVHPDRPLHLAGGYSFPDHSPDFRATDFHGTHVAGIIAAPQNGTGRVGVAPGAILHIYNVFAVRAGRLGASDADVIAAIDAAIADGCQIVNMSFGGARNSELEHQALQRAYAAGLLLVAAAGNSENASRGAIRTAYNYPAAYPEVIAVGATTASEEIAPFSSTGPVLSLAAPGVALYSTVPVQSGEREAVLSCESPSRGTFSIAAYSVPGGSGTSVAGVPLGACGFGSPAEIMACSPLGHLALIQRGPAEVGQQALTFAEKIRNSRQKGAAGILLFNHRAGEPAQAGGLLTDIDIGGGVPVPVAALAAGDGEFLAERLLSGGEALRCSLATRPSDWATFDGTSLAAPVVSGVAALVLSRFPGLSNVALRQLLAESAVDLGAPGRDDAFGWGRVDAGRALSQAAPIARCGDGRIDPSSEICDGANVNAAACEDLGYDGVAGGAVVCNTACSGLDLSGCRCVPGRVPFDVRVSLLHGYEKGATVGTLAFYQVSLGGQPVRGAYAAVTLRAGSRDIRTDLVGPSGTDGSIPHFLAEGPSGLLPGSYDVFPVITKANGRCRDAEPLPPFSIQVRD